MEGTIAKRRFLLPAGKTLTLIVRRAGCFADLEFVLAIAEIAGQGEA